MRGKAKKKQNKKITHCSDSDHRRFIKLVSHFPDQVISHAFMSARLQQLKFNIVFYVNNTLNDPNRNIQ